LIDQNQKSNNCIIKSTPDQIISLATNDIGYTNQWALKNSGQNINGSVGIHGLDIGFELAYPKINTTPKGFTKVAIIDTGVNNIPDISEQLIGGYNAVTENSNATDDNGHGTFVASIIGSTVNNAQGIAGINDRVQIIPIKVLGADGNGLLSDLIKGIQYAIDQNAHIINLSLTTSTYASSLDTIIDAAYQRGIIIVAAAGNEGNNLTVPSISPLHNDGGQNKVIGVGSINNQGGRPSFANDGFGVDILAPGENILGINQLNSLQYRSGTSISAAVVSGVISAWRDYYGSLTSQDTISLMNSSSQSRIISMNNAMIQRNYPNGALVRSPQSGVYLIRQGVKRPITDPSIFLSYYYRWEDILVKK
jgi:subtilisin family serine protease